MEFNHNQQENNLNLMSFDLGEAGGGQQMIFAHKSLSETEHYVFALGNPPKDEQTTKEQPAPAKETASKQLLNNFRNRFGNLKGGNQAEASGATQSNLKLRCFKLKHVEGKKYLVEEYTTPQRVADVARFFGAGKDEPEMSK